MQRRPMAIVPRPLLLLAASALALQLAWQFNQSASLKPAPVLGAAPALATLRLASLGEPVALSKALMLYVQSHDDDDANGVHLRAWLAHIVALDPRAQYPLLAASQVYAGGQAQRTRVMLDFIHAAFLDDPQRRWPWLAHATLVAKHRLHDLPLAQRYASELRRKTEPARLPAWAQQMEVFILEDMNEDDSATALIGAMLASGQVKDARELAFLERRLAGIAARQRQRAP